MGGLLEGGGGGQRVCWGKGYIGPPLGGGLGLLDEPAVRLSVLYEVFL